VTDHVHLGRQPIVDSDRQLFGYELLYRAGPDQQSTFDDPDAATRGVMERVLLQWGMEHVVGDRFGLVNAGASLVVHGLHRAMPAEGMIIEMREDEPFDDDVLAALQQARWDGYHFALDNVGRLGDLERSRLLPLSNIVKIELTTAHDAEIPRLIAVARERAPGVLVVAEKVETVEQFKRCVEHGFDLFQGWYIAQPEILARPARPAGRSSAEALQRSLLDDQLDIEQLESTMALDPSLTFRLLTAVNANAFGLDRDVRSLEQAMALLGPEKLRCLAELIATSSDTIDDDADILRGAVRARMAAALLAGTDSLGSGVTVALLSATDSLYGVSMRELLDELPVTDEIASALLHGHGHLGRTIDIIRACERGDLLALSDLAPGRGDELTALYDEAAAAINDLVSDDARSGDDRVLD
jgi:c-di-GMP-related signal transduction protein